jgi:hypothetical protein
MLHHPTVPKHKSKIKRKKYSHSKLRRGIKVYTYNIGDYCFFTSRPKQKGSKAYSLEYALWLIRYYNGVMDRR